MVSPIGVLINAVLGAFQLFDLFAALAFCGMGIFVGIGMFLATKALSKGFIRYLQFNVSLVKRGIEA